MPSSFSSTTTFAGLSIPYLRAISIGIIRVAEILLIKKIFAMSLVTGIYGLTVLNYIRHEPGFTPMNGHDLSKYEPPQERKVREHKDNILYALRVLKNATSGEIKKFIDNKVESEVNQQYENKPEYLLIDKELLPELIETDLRWKKMSKRTIQKWLPKLKKDGLVIKDKYNEYSLTTRGKMRPIFPYSYGKILFYHLVGKPLFTSSDKERITECIKRFGLYILSVFIYNLTIKDRPLSTPNFLEDLFNWPEEIISPRDMFQWFFSIFRFELTDPDIEHIAKIFTEEYPQYLKAFERTNTHFEDQAKAQEREKFYHK
jgi:hypothetical protein